MLILKLKRGSEAVVKTDGNPYYEKRLVVMYGTE